MSPIPLGSPPAPKHFRSSKLVLPHRFSVVVVGVVVVVVVVVEVVVDIAVVVEAVVLVLVDVVLVVDVLVDVVVLVFKLGGSIFSKINFFLGYGVIVAGLVRGCSSSSLIEFFFFS